MGAGSAVSVAAVESESRYVFPFSDGGAGDAAILGGKGAGLAHMTSLGLPVPPGFVVSCRTGRAFLAQGRLPAASRKEIEAHIDALETQTGRRLGDPGSPLLVSVRSGAPVSMPGMMDTILNVGLNSVTVRALALETGDEEFAWACYERFAESYARVVRDVDPERIESCLMDVAARSPKNRSELASALLTMIEEHDDGVPVPDDPREQILEAAAAVFRSWESPRAKTYRRFRGIADDICTAATVQAMVFGNMGRASASGVAFTRDPSSGAPAPFGDVLFNAQGEDVVAGERDAEPLSALGEQLPAVDEQLAAALQVIEADAGDLCEVEFTIEQGVLWVLQTRVGLRSGRAAVRIAVALVNEGRISIADAIDRITPAQLEAAAAPGFVAEPAADRIIARGLAASPGAASGVVAFDPARATGLAGGCGDVILLRPTTSPSDVAGFIAARGIVTGRGGRTSHAAVVARGMHRPAVCGIGEVRISDDRRAADVAGVVLHEGELVSVDGDRGLLIRGEHELDSPASDPAVRTFLLWCSERASVPALDPAEVAALPVVATMAELDDNARMILDLEDPSSVSPQELARALVDREGPPPVLRIAPQWLRAADVRLRGRVSGLLIAEHSPSRPLLEATLTPA
jgi:pyruvate, orthophosphate dikinase